MVEMNNLERLNCIRTISYFSDHLRDVIALKFSTCWGSLAWEKFSVYSS